MFARALPAGLTLADRFAWLFDGLCKAIGAHALERGAALAWAVWNRVRLLGERLIALAARVRSGRLPRSGAARHDTSPRLVRPAAQSPQNGEGEERPAGGAAAVRLPREFGWLRQALPETAQFAGVLSYLLRDPETAALLERTPEAGRVLRPLCHLLGVKRPEFLRPRYAATADPPPHLTSPPPRAERNDSRTGSAAASQEPPSTDAEKPVAAQAPAEVQAPVTPAAAQAQPAPAMPARPPPGGLYWDGRRWQWH